MDFAHALPEMATSMRAAAEAVKARVGWPSMRAVCSNAKEANLWRSRPAGRGAAFPPHQNHDYFPTRGHACSPGSST